MAQSKAGNQILFLVGSCVLGYEIVLTRAASAFFQYHFAFLVLSIAMLSLFASGVFYQRLAPVSERLIRGVMWILFAFLVASPALFDAFIPVAVVRTGLLLFGFGVLFCGSFVAVHYLQEASATGTAYGANLFGSAFGAALAMIALISAGPVFGVIALAALAGLIVFLQLRRILDLAVVVALVALSAGLSARMSPGSNVLWERWNSFSYVKVMNQRGPVMWGSHGTLPPSLDLLIDSSADTAILTNLAPDARIGVERGIAGDITHVGYAFAPRPLDVAIVGSGGGRDVLGAQYFEPRTLLAVEINPSVIAATKQFSPETYAGVHLVVAEGRSTLERSKGGFSIIQFGLVDTWAAVSSGTFALSENYLYTREAFAGYLGKLKPGGILSVTRWGTEADHLLSVSAAGLHDVGIEAPERHILTVEKDVNSEYPLITALIKLTPWSDAERQQAQQLAVAAGYQLRPFRPVTLSPAVDDSPFFFFTSEGTRVIFLAIAVLLLASGALFVMATPRTFNWHLPTLVFFGAIGMAYMFVENVFLQKFILLIRNPTIAVSTVFLAFLLFSGIGSLCSQRIRFGYAALIVPVLLLFYAASGRIITSALTLDLGVKLALTVVCIGPAAFLMGLFFPTGFERVKATRRGAEGMAWAINGLFSVIAPPFALLLAITSGFGVVLLAATALYSVALLVAPRV